MEPPPQDATRATTGKTRLIPVAWAAILEGVHENTIRGRVERGMLFGAEGAHNGRAVLMVSPDRLNLSPAAHEILRAALRWRSSSEVAEEIAGHVRGHFGELEENRLERISRLSEQAGYWRARAEAAEAQVARLEELERG